MKTIIMVPTEVDITITDVHTSPKDSRSKWDRTPKVGNPRVFVWPKGESILDNLSNRHDRPYETWKPFAEQAVQFITADKRKYKLMWSQYAGCSCPCSPGFIVKDLKADYDIHVDIECKEVS